MANKKIIPKTQSQLSQATITPYDKLNQGKVPLRTPIKRAENRSVKNDDVKQFHVGLRDIDETIVYYFNEVIKPSVVRNGKDGLQYKKMDFIEIKMVRFKHLLLCLREIVLKRIASLEIN